MEKFLLLSVVEEVREYLLEWAGWAAIGCLARCGRQWRRALRLMLANEWTDREQRARALRLWEARALRQRIQLAEMNRQWEDAQGNYGQ